MSAATKVRVTVADGWQTVALDVTSDETVARLKGRALATQRIGPDRADRYEVKFGGARVRDESRTLGSLGIRTGSAFIVLSSRRRAVR